VKRLLTWFCLANGFSPLFAEALFTTGKNTHTLESLPSGFQQSVYDAKKQYYDSLSQISETALLDSHVKKEAEKKKISVEEVEKELFTVSPVSEGEAKKWFDANQFRLGGRPFDGVKTDIMHFLSMEKQQKKREELIQKLKIQESYAFVLAKPIPPKMKIDTEGFPSKGPSTAKVTIVEFADYQCPHCQSTAEVMKKVVSAYENQVKFVFLDYPLSSHRLAFTIAEGAVCADAQGKFWDYHYMAFGNQANLTTDSPTTFAKTLALDMKTFSTCLQASATKDKVLRSKKKGDELHIEGTPTIYIGGIKHTQGYTVESLSASIDEALKKAI
jgi:protein-disulfide isomerase